MRQRQRLQPHMLAFQHHRLDTNRSRIHRKSLRNKHPADQHQFGRRALKQKRAATTSPSPSAHVGAQPSAPHQIVASCERPYTFSASTTKSGPFVGTTLVNLNPEPSNNVANSAWVRSFPPGSSNISKSSHFAKCGSFPGATTDSIKITRVFPIPARAQFRRIVVAFSSFQSWMMCFNT